MPEPIIPTIPIDEEEYIDTIFEDVVIAGVESINGETGALSLKTVNGNSLLGEGDVEIQAGVTSVNGETGDVVITASDLGAATSSDLETLAGTVSGKQDALDSTQMNAVNSGIDATKVGQIATNTQNIADEITARQNADINLQGQIDGLAASSDVTDVVGTKAQLNAYDTSKLKDNDIVKVLQDESQSGETTYYRWSTTTQTFTLIGEEGPYYTKAEADILLNAKVDKVTGYGLSENNFSDSDVTKLSGIATGAEVNTIESISVNGTAVSPDVNKNVDITVSSGPTVVQTTGISTTDVMSQNAVTSMVFSNPGTNTKVKIGAGASTSGIRGVAIGQSATAAQTNTVAIGSFSTASAQGEFSVGGSSLGTNGYNSSSYRLITNVYDPQSAHDAATKGYVDGLVGNVETILQTLNSGNGAS